MSDPARLFLFIQCELPWTPGPPDGRYLLRSPRGEPERVIVLGTLGARRGALGRGGRGRREAADRGWTRAIRGRRRRVAPEPEPPPAQITRATIVDPVPVSAERQARAWLSELDSGREIAGAFHALNRMLYARRIAAADPYAHEVSPAQALVVRAGWGEGEQVAEGQWLHAVELSVLHALASMRHEAPGRRSGGAAIGRRRARALRPEERLARLLAGREAPLLCEELALRARADLDQGRIAHAALELDHALSAAARELAGEQRADLPLRVAELESLHPGVAELAQAALGGGPPEGPGEGPIRHALGRLEALLRARSALGFGEP